LLLSLVLQSVHLVETTLDDINQAITIDASTDWPIQQHALML